MDLIAKNASDIFVRNFLLCCTLENINVNLFKWENLLQSACDLQNYFKDIGNNYVYTITFWLIFKSKFLA